MKVLFLKEVAGTAKPGDVREVSPGYARNFLFPQHLAVIADQNTVDQIRRRVEKALIDAKETAQRLRKLTVTVYAKAGEAGRLFGTVTTADVAKQLKREAGIDIDKRKIEIDPPIRSLGPHEATIELHPEVTETLKVVVAAQ
jgi:large subunit ribosomal protein L9